MTTTEIPSNRAGIPNVNRAVPVDCEAIRDLPDKVEDCPEETRPKTAGVLHAEGCPHCRRRWQRFSSIGSLLGIGALVGMAYAVVSATPAVAAPLLPTPAPTGDTTATPEGTAGSGHPSPADEASSSSLDGNVHAPCRRRTATGTAVGALVGASLVALGWGLTNEHAAAQPPAVLAVAASNHGGLALDLDFSVDADVWTAGDIEIQLPEGVRLLASPEGWDCTATGPIVDCADPFVRPLAGTFLLDGEAGDIVVGVQARSGAYDFAGQARLEVPPPGESVSTRTHLR
jgi:hypothetical protein